MKRIIAGITLILALTLTAAVAMAENGDIGWPKIAPTNVSTHK